MPSPSDDAESIGKYIIHDKRLIKSAKSKIVPEQAKNEFLNILATTSVQKKYAVEKKEKDDSEETTQTVDAKVEGRRTFVQKINNENWKSNLTPSPALRAATKELAKRLRVNDMSSAISESGSCEIGACVKLMLRTIVDQATKISKRGNRNRLVPDDIDLAVSMLKIDLDLIAPVVKTTTSTERMFWGRRARKPPFLGKVDQHKQYVSSEEFCESIVIKDHWLCIGGIQPCVPENVTASEVKKKIKEQQEEIQKKFGFGQPGVKKDYTFEKRMSKQIFAMEHQVLFNEVVNILANGSPLERQKVLHFLETDSGLQFLTGRFVVFIAEGARINIGAKNVRSLGNLVKLAWSLMKNPKIRLERYLYVLVPSLISCIATKSITPIADGRSTGFAKPRPPLAQNVESSLTQDDEERIIRDLDMEFRLRECTSRVLSLLCDEYPNECLNVRVIQLLRPVLTIRIDPASIYGALCTYFAFGYLTIKSVVIPKLHDIYCGLMTSGSEEIEKLRMGKSKMRRIVVESEAKRIELMKNRVVELIMKILYEYEICEYEKRVVEEETFVKSYAEFGSMFYRHLIETGKIDDDGKVAVTRNSLMKGARSFGMENEGDKKQVGQKNKYMGPSRLQGGLDDEDMLENLLDDSHRPWIEVSKKVEEKEGQESSSESANISNTFFGQSKIVLIRKAKPSSLENSKCVSYVRPLESAHMPSIPSIRSVKKSEKSGSILNRSAGSVRTSRTTMSVDDFALALTVSKEPAELLRKYMSRPTTQAGAVTYGRELEISEKGRCALDKQIADASTQLSNIRLRNAVVNSRTNPSAFKNESNRGKFLATTNERGNRL